MTKMRGKNLDDECIDQIVKIVDGWSGQLSWTALLDVVESRLLQRYTRQAFSKHPRIQAAFARRKAKLAGAIAGIKKRKLNPEQEIEFQRNSRLNAELERLRAENQTLLEQFVRWAYNAHTRGLDQAFLSKPLPDVDRDCSKPAISRVKNAGGGRG